MQLAGILVIIVATLALLTGITVAFGSKTSGRMLSSLFLVAIMSAALWAYAVIVFLNLPGSATALAPVVVTVVYVAAVVMVVGMFGYAAKFSGSKSWSTITLVFAAIGLLLLAIIIIRPQSLYYEILLNSETGNVVNLRFGWLYIAYVVFFVAVLTVYGVILVRKILSKPSTAVRNICILLLVGPGIGGVVSLYFDLLLPFERYDLIWVGPVSFVIVIICLFYAILRYRMVAITVRWMKIMSYVILIATMALVYVVLLFVLSTLILKRPYIIFEDLFLNFVMIAVVFLMMPGLSELMVGIRSLLSIDTTDIGYIAKRLNRFGTGDVKMKELAVFLADHLHFSFVGIVIGDKLYGSKDVEFTAKDIEIGAIENKNDPDQIWRTLKNKEGDRVLEHKELRAIVDLRDIEGRTFGRIVFGSPSRDKLFEEEDFSQLEMVVSLVAMAVNPGKKK